MMARSSTASLEKVKRIGMCIIGGGRARSMRTLTCHSPWLSATLVVLTLKLPAAHARAGKTRIATATRAA